MAVHTDYNPPRHAPRHPEADDSDTTKCPNNTVLAIAPWIGSVEALAIHVWAIPSPMVVYSAIHAMMMVVVYAMKPIYAMVAVSAICPVMMVVVYAMKPIYAMVAVSAIYPMPRMVMAVVLAIMPIYEVVSV